VSYIFFLPKTASRNSDDQALASNVAVTQQFDGGFEIVNDFLEARKKRFYPAPSRHLRPTPGVSYPV